MAKVHISPASVDFLQNILGFVKNAGGPLVAQNLTPNIGGFTVHNEDAYLKNEFHFLEGMHNLTRLREAHRTLLHLLSSIESTQHALRSAMRPAVLARGVGSLPDEILSHILALAVGRQGWKLALWLSWVSRRFRAVALATPHLWSSLPPSGLDDLSREAMMCFVERSKTVGLTVELPPMITGEYEPNPEWPEIVEFLMDRKHRWKELIVDLAVAVEENDENALQNRPKSTFPKASLDSVERLVIADSSQRILWPDYSHNDKWYGDASLDFYSNWMFPNLKSLKSEMRIPPPNVLPPNLVEFSLDLSTHDVPELRLAHPRTVTENLTKFLHSQPALRTFKFCVGGYPVLARAKGRIKLPELTTLHLENNSDCPISLRILKDLSRALWMPKVKSISLRLIVDRALGGTNDKLCFVKSFFPQRREFSGLESLRLDCEAMNSMSGMLMRGARCFSEPREYGDNRAPPQISGVLEHDIRRRPSLKSIRFKDARSGQKTIIRKYEILGEGISSNVFSKDEILDTDRAFALSMGFHLSLSSISLY